jgi:hypothetical protein
MYECDKNQLHYCNVKKLKCYFLIFFGSLIKHGPHWINFIIFIFISENNRYFRSLHKIWNKIIIFDMRKKVKCKIGHGKNKNKNEFGSPKSESLSFKWGTQIMLRPIGQYEWSHHSTTPTWKAKISKVYTLWCAIINAWMHEHKKAIYVYII